MKSQSVENLPSVKKVLMPLVMNYSNTTVMHAQKLDTPASNMLNHVTRRLLCLTDKYIKRQAQ